MGRQRDGRNRGVPDLDQLKEAPEVYFERHETAVREHDFEGRVMAIWGLIARGIDAVPYLTRMLRSPLPEAREDAAGAFGWMARDDASVVPDLIDALEQETEPVVIDSLILALGELRDRRAVEAIARIVLSADTDGDTRHTAVQSLGRIARRRFDRDSDPLAAARAWLASKGHTPPDGPPPV